MSTIQFFTDRNCLEACDLIDGRPNPLGATQFELRMFLVDLGNGQCDWYGSLQTVNDGNKKYFRGWSGLVSNLQRFLSLGAQLIVLRALIPFDHISYEG